MKMKRRRRKAAVIAAVAVIAVLTCSGIRKGCAVESEEVAVVTRTVEQYEVQFGDSLSSITAKYCPEYIDSRKYLYDLQRLNDRKSNIYAGEVLKVYVYR